MLREMRKTDRDRDGVLRPEQVEAFMDKYAIPIQGVMSHLQRRFVDDKFEGMTNYEDFLRYLTKMRLKSQEQKLSSSAQVPVTEAKSESTQELAANKQRSSGGRQTSTTFEDRGEARLILDLEAAIANSPKFDLGQFRKSLESKDMYGNEQVSKQHVIQAAQNSKLSVPRDVFGRWLVSSDPINRGIYSIPKLVNFLERSQPHVISRMKTAKSHGHLACEWISLKS